MSSKRSLVVAAVLVIMAGCITVNINRQPPSESEVSFTRQDSRAWSQTCTDFTDDFESYVAGPGKWPGVWIADANAQKHDVSYVDGETFRASHGNTLRLHAGDTSWSALAYTALDLQPPFKASFDVYSTQGCMCIGLRERPTWKSPGLGLFTQWSAGAVAIFDRIGEGGHVAAGVRPDTFTISPENWYHVDLEIQSVDGAQTITLRVADSQSVQGPHTFQNPAPFSTSFAFLELNAEVGTVWYDNVTIELLSE